MKKLLKTLICSIVAVTLCFSFTACSLFDSNDSTSETTYTIQYSDDNGTHTISVTNGQSYSLESIPERLGYTFLGLYDSKTGGTQYVDSDGLSVSAYTDKTDITLYPQYQAKEYTLVLDYGEAAVTGSRQYTVAYGESLPTLPTNLTVTHKVFSGWYTEENCGGTKVADLYGLIPLASVLNSDNFEITSSTTYLYLYAGFTTETYSVTFNYGSGIASETMEVEYGTNVSDIVTSTRNSSGYAVISWGLSYSGSEYTGKITEDISLYALEWAPCITFNTNGGDSINSIIARAGDAISLPTATKESYKFMYWADSAGNESMLTTMPSASITLTAVWQAMITFDSNGGSDVSAISEAAGTTITLPAPEKDGYVFAGWYTSDKTQYTSTKMPSASIELKAGWYKAKTVTIILGKDSSDSDDWGYHRQSSTGEYGPVSTWRKETDLSDYISAGTTINLSFHIDMKSSNSADSLKGGLYLYDGSTISDANLLYKYVDSVNSTSWRTYTFSCTVEMRDDILYTCYYYNKLSNNSGSSTYLYFKNLYFDMEYPDTTTLYL